MNIMRVKVDDLVLTKTATIRKDSGDSPLHGVIVGHGVYHAEYSTFGNRPGWYMSTSFGSIDEKDLKLFWNIAKRLNAGETDFEIDADNLEDDNEEV